MEVAILTLLSYLKPINIG